MKNIKLQGAKNIRDFGGIVNREGCRIKEKRFLRSSALDGLTKKDRQILTEDYRLGEIIDLRTDEEVKGRPDVKMEGVTNYHLSLLNIRLPGISHEKDDEETYKLIPDMRDLYRKIVGDSFAIAQLKEVFSHILNAPEEQSILWHCTEGKDRCGMTSALFLYLLDVDMKTIYEDYLFTNQVAAKKASRFYWMIRIFKRDRNLAEKARAAFIADAINVPNETIGTKEIPELPDKEQLIMVYCRSGNRSKQASEKLVKIGYSNIVEFGGIKDWPGETVSGKFDVGMMSQHLFIMKEVFCLS